MEILGACDVHFVVTNLSVDVLPGVSGPPLRCRIGETLVKGITNHTRPQPRLPLS
jgi:hypothetical protein